MEKKIKKVKSSILAITLLLVTMLSLVACTKSPEDFTEEEHIQRISERVKMRFMSEESDYTSFNVYPLHNENEELKYFLVEFEPYGFVFIWLQDEQSKVFSWLYSTSMYRLSTLYGEYTWSPYTIDESNSQPFPDTDICWKVDENGEKINYRKSPYYVTNNISERKYLLRTISVGYICAIKKGETFINLISSTEVNITNGDLTKKQAVMDIAFIADKRFDL